MHYIFAKKLAYMHITISFRIEILFVTEISVKEVCYREFFLLQKKKKHNRIEIVA